MRYKLTPDTPRPLDRTGATVAPDQDARWRGLSWRLVKTPTKPQRRDRLAVLEAQRRTRQGA